MKTILKALLFSILSLLWIFKASAQTPASARTYGPIDRSALFEVIHKGYPLYLPYVVKEIEADFNPFEKEFITELLRYLPHYPDEHDLIYSDNPNEFVMKPGEPPRAARTGQWGPIFVNRSTLNDPKVAWTLADVFQLYFHEFSHRIDFKYASPYYRGSPFDKVSPESQAKIDSLGAKLRAAFERHVQAIRMGNGESLEVLHFPLQPSVTDVYRLKEQKIWKYDLAPYQIRLLQHSSTKVTDWTPQFYRALQKTPHLEAAAPAKQDIAFTNAIEKLIAIETFQIKPLSDSTKSFPFEIRLREHQYLYEESGWGGKEKALEREQVMKGGFGDTAVLEKDLRFIFRISRGKAASFRPVALTPTTIEHESQMLDYRIEGEHFFVRIKIKGPIAADTRFTLLGEFQDQEFHFPGKLISQSGSESIFEIQGKIPSVAKFPTLTFNSVVLKNGNTSEKVDMDRTERLTLRAGSLVAPRIVSAHIESQKMKIQVQSDSEIQEIRLKVIEGRLRYANPDAPEKYQFRRTLQKDLVFTQNEFQQTKVGSTIQLTLNLPGSQMPAIDFDQPMQGLGWDEKLGWVTYDTPYKFEISESEIQLSQLQVVSAQLAPSPQSDPKMRYRVSRSGAPLAGALSCSIIHRQK